jgi:two-component system cell cycle sensor histidine kinase/response regulator CckA
MGSFGPGWGIFELKEFRQNLRTTPYWKITLAAVTLAVCVILLLVKIYRGQTDLRGSVLNNFRHDLEKNAASLSYFYTERKNDLKNLPTNREISIFFENKALGMSMEYGLRASLVAIQESLESVLRDRTLGRDPIYTRFVVADGSGECLIDTQKSDQFQGKYCQEFVTPERFEPFILVKRLNGATQLIVSSPYFFKGTYSGQVVAWISTETVHKHLIGADSQRHKRIARVFSSQGNFYLPAATVVSAPPTFLPDFSSMRQAEYTSFEVADPTGANVEMISTWVPIKDTPLFLVGATQTKELFGYLDPKHLLLLLGFLSFFSLFGGIVVWWTNTRNLLLHTRLEEASIREREIAVKNRQLEEEIVIRKRVEEALRSAEENYRTIFENAVEGIFQSTPNGRLLSANPAMAKMHSYDTPEELLSEVTDIGRQIYVDPRRRDEFKRRMESEGYVKGFECQVYKRGGGKVWISMSARAVYGGWGEISYYEGFAQDITEQKEAEELSRHLITASPIGIYIIQDGKFKLANQWFHEITAISKDELSLIDPASLIHPDDRQEVNNKAAGMLAGRISTPYEYRVIARGGKTKWIVETIVPTAYQGKDAVLGFFMDITGHKELEKQLLQSQKMEAVGRLAGGVAHDFNNMLGAIVGYTEMLMQRLNQGDPTYHYGEEIRKAADRASMLTRQLLAFSRKQVLQPKELNLNTIINDVEKMLRRLIGEDVELTLNLEPTLASVKADAGQMEQVILNLAVNARDAMPKGGKLLISTTNVVLDEAYALKQTDFTPGPYTLLKVNDTGLGMDMETMDRIFEPFFTTKELGSGTGLGLSTVYGIVNQSGGFIEVSSSPDTGSSFEIFLPAVKTSLESSEAKPADRAPLQGTETILLVEDEEILRQLIKEALEMNGYKVLVARNAKEALAICEQNQEPIHLALTDVVMPQMSGRELAQRLRQLRPELKVIYMSGYTEDVLFRQGVLDASLAFLQKPFRQYELTVKVRQALDAGTEG